METTLMILMAIAQVVLAVLVGLLVLRLIYKNDVIVREIRRNQKLIDKAVQNGVKRSAML
jgi:uncharacterized membrane protein YqiK